MKKLIYSFVFLFVIIIYSFGQNVGIGTTTPAAQLHTTGTVRHGILNGVGVRPVYADANGNLLGSLPALPSSTGTNSTAQAIPNFNCLGVTSNINISQLPVSVASANIKVTVNITHPKLRDLLIYLTAPNGNIISLFGTGSSFAANLTNTSFSDAGASISGASSPYTGTFKPKGDLVVTFCGVVPTVATFAAIGGGTLNPNGLWQLKVIDSAATNTGTLHNWSVYVNTGVAADGVWNLKGNSGTNENNFFGTTDAQPLMLRLNNIYAGKWDYASGNYFFGLNAGKKIVTGTGNIVIGNGALSNIFIQRGTVAIGDSALYSSSVVSFANVAIGEKSLYSNISGGSNTAIGHNASLASQGGNQNTAIGASALRSNTGSGNTGVGSAALYNNKDVGGNTAIGNASMAANETGSNNTAVGAASLSNSRYGSSNVAIGAGVLYFNFDRSNLVAVGDSALYNNGGYGTLANHEAIKNTAIGSKGLFANTTGYNNTALGFNALLSNTSGHNNTVGGVGVMLSNILGHSNVAFGASALANNQGNHNTGIGYQALFSNIGGRSNVAIGTGALYKNTSRNQGVAVGDSSLYNNGVNATESFHAYGNTAVGSKSLYTNTSGFTNTALGHSALYNNSTGANNTGVGFAALDGNGSGNNNTAIGAYSKTASNNLENATAIGANAVVSASNSLVLGSNVKVGIGTSAPQFNLDILSQSNNGAYINVKSNISWSGIVLDKSNVGSQNSYVVYRTGGSDKWSLGTHGNNNFGLHNWSNGGLVFSVNAATNNVGIGDIAPAAKLHVQSPNIANTPSGDILMSRYWVGNSDTRASSIFHYYNAINISDNLAFAVSGEGGSYIQPNNINQVKMNILANGRVGIGTLYPIEKLDVAGLIHSSGYRCRTGTGGSSGSNSFNIYWTGASAQLWIDAVNIGTFSYTSDRRLKDNINLLNNNAISRMQALKPVYFTYKKMEGTVFEGSSIAQEGFVADELQQVIPSAVNGEKNALTTKGTIQPQTVNITPVVAVLTKAMQEQQVLIDEQNKRLKTMQADIDMLKAALANKQ